MDIQWKPVEGFEEDYEVSNRGDVRRIRYIKGSSKQELPYILSKRINNSGYVHYSLTNGKITKNLLAHRLVAIAFIPNDNPLRNQINHINGNKQDNRIENLEWVTQSENRQHFHKYLEWDWKNNPKMSMKICQYDKNGTFIAEYPSQAEAQRQTGISQAHIHEVIKGNRHTAGGYIWKKSTES